MKINWKSNVALFLGGQALTIFGSSVVQYAILWHITLDTQSGTMMTVFSVALFLPMFFISPFAGVWADRFNKKYIINISDGCVAFASLIVAVLLFLGIDHIGILLACAIVRSFGQGVQMPSIGALIPQLAPQEHLTRVNGIQGSIQSISMLAAPMVSGLLMSFAPLETLFMVDVVTAIIGISILFFLVKVPAAPASTKQNAETGGKGIDYFYDIREGLRYIRKHKFVFRLIAISTAFFIAISPTMLLTTLQVTRNFGADVWRLTAIEVVFLSGMIAGGFIISVWGGFKNRIYSMALSCALCGMQAVGLGLASNFVLYCVIMGLMGLIMPLYNTPAMVLMQTKVESAYLGRALAVFTMAYSIMVPAGMVLFGPLADIITIDAILIITGAIIVLMSILFVASKTMREAGKSHL
ncbi:MAG: MFS transporter [Elusimicrobiota bacterium]|jgi:DHA3 family macrolide efflux protein-like MFS transporter|nr:MFS transporter [Elusimicrobiota bacterium]